MNLSKKLVAEGLGTLLLVLLGTGVATSVSNLVFLNVTMLYTALAFGLTLMLLIFAFGGVSGGHFNPAVSFAMYLRKDIDLKSFLLYVAAQFGGALVGSLILAMFLNSNQALGSNVVSAAVAGEGLTELLNGGLVEVLLTFVFVFVILRVTRQESLKPTAGFIIGLTLFTMILFGFYLTGVGINPARSFAPALFEGGTALSQVWVFLLFPMIGSALAFLLDNFLEKK